MCKYKNSVRIKPRYGQHHHCLYTAHHTLHAQRKPLHHHGFPLPSHHCLSQTLCQLHQTQITQVAPLKVTLTPPHAVRCTLHSSVSRQLNLEHANNQSYPSTTFCGRSSFNRRSQSGLDRGKNKQSIKKSTNERNRENMRVAKAWVKSRYPTATLESKRRASFGSCLPPRWLCASRISTRRPRVSGGGQGISPSAPAPWWVIPQLPTSRRQRSPHDSA